MSNHRKGCDGSKEPWLRVSFNIKNNVLWKNGEVDFRDHVYHELRIPFQVDKGKLEGMILPAIYEQGLEIRLLLVNGLIKLQIGDYPEELSPSVLDTKVYKRYDTIASFPLMYFLPGIPENYLNVTCGGTESYRMLHSAKQTKKTDIFEDWRILRGEVCDYNYINGLGHNSGGKREEEILDAFKQKREKWLELQGFRELWTGNYSNRYLHVGIEDFKEYRGRFEVIAGEYYEHQHYF